MNTFHANFYNKISIGKTQWQSIMTQISVQKSGSDVRYSIKKNIQKCDYVSEKKCN